MWYFRFGRPIKISSETQRKNVSDDKSKQESENKCVYSAWYKTETLHNFWFCFNMVMCQAPINCIQCEIENKFVPLPTMSNNIYYKCMEVGKVLFELMKYLPEYVFSIVSIRSIESTVFLFPPVLAIRYMRIENCIVHGGNWSTPNVYECLACKARFAWVGKAEWFSSITNSITFIHIWASPICRDATILQRSSLLDCARAP